MDFSIHHFFMLSAIFTLLVLPPSIEANAPSKVVADLCSQTSKQTGSKYDDCVSALALDPKTASADLKTLAKISIQLGISNTTDTQNYIKNLLKNAAGDLQKTLQTCLSGYVAATYSFKSALEELGEDLLSANYDCKTVGDDVGECEDAMTRSKAQIPQLTTRNFYGHLYSNIGFMVTDLLDS